MWFWLIYIAIVVPFAIFFPVKVYGKKNYNKNKKCILVCNHQSGLDPVILYLKLKSKIRFIAKKELWRGKEKTFLFDTALGCIPVDRKKGMTMETTKKVLNILKENKTIGIFPEGTRHNNGVNEDMDVKNGACMFALKTQSPILPCYIAKKHKIFTKNVLIVGKPFELSEFYGQKMTKEVLSACSDILVKNLNDIKLSYERMLEEKQILKQLKNKYKK